MIDALGQLKLSQVFMYISSFVTWYSTVIIQCMVLHVSYCDVMIWTGFPQILALCQGNPVVTGFATQRVSMTVTPQRHDISRHWQLSCSIWLILKRSSDSWVASALRCHDDVVLLFKNFVLSCSVTWHWCGGHAPYISFISHFPIYRYCDFLQIKVFLKSCENL